MLNGDCNNRADEISFYPPLTTKAPTTTSSTPKPTTTTTPTPTPKPNPKDLGGYHLVKTGHHWSQTCEGKWIGYKESLDKCYNMVKEDDYCGNKFEYDSEGNCSCVKNPQL